MTEIEMMRDFPIAPNGIKVEIWQRGSTRHVDDATLRLLISEGACAIVERDKVYTPVQETKNIVGLSDTDDKGKKHYLKSKAKRSKK